MKPILITSGEPAGIGPDLCLAMAAYELPIVVMADQAMLARRADQLGLRVVLESYHPEKNLNTASNHLTILPISAKVTVESGKVNPQNAAYVMHMLTDAVKRCLSQEFSALVTAPVHKEVINQGGFHFSGHTEFLAQSCQVQSVVMMLACKTMKVALVTTHLPLNAVAQSITQNKIYDVISIVHAALKNDFGHSTPKIYVAGLNPHAGEGGYLGQEEIQEIIPALARLKQQGIHVVGPLPADTMFTAQHASACDVFVAMYHDQGLPVLKYAGFGQAVNVTLGLPIVRTSVDHGTALDLAGTGKAHTGSMLAAVEMAAWIAKRRKHGHE